MTRPKLASLLVPTSTLALGLALATASGCVHTHATPPPPAAVPANKPPQELGTETGIPMSSTPKGLMHEGAEKAIQVRLRDKGLLKAEQCTGQLDADTREALRNFQKSEGLPTTGLPSYETVDHLGLKLESIFRTSEHPAGRAPAHPGSPGAGSPGARSPG
jgi:peptidoglycan hydrolase-like protein with peptidoglycan-binding domain